MAITGIDTIEGKQIIAAGAVSAKSAEMAYNDENGNPITGYLTAVPEGYATTGDLNDLVTSISETYQPTAGMTAYQPAGDYYSASNPSGFITGVDLTPYQLTADMTGYLTTGDSANFYTTANESGFLTGLPIDISVRDLNASRHVRATVTGQDIYGNFDFAGMYFRSGSQRPYNIGIDNTGSNFYIATAKNGFERIYASSIQSWNSKGDMFESAFSYDASNNITAYNGSAFKAGDEFPQSATEAIETVTANSADWNGTTETVSSNSGAWGGSALPISAGPGIAINMVNNTIVVSAVPDETLLYSTSSPANTINLSEVSTGFEKLRLELSSYQSREIVNYTEVKPNASYLTYFANALIPAATYPLQIAGIQFTANNAKDYTMTTGVRMCYKVNGTYGDQYTTISTTNIRDVGFITKIWGINRITGV